MKTLQNDQPVTEECPLKIRLGGKLVPFSKIMVRRVYQELQKESVYNESYKQKWETTVKDTPICWNEIWSNNIHKVKTSLEIMSTVYSQIHLGFYSEYLPVKSGALDSLFANCVANTFMGRSTGYFIVRHFFGALDYFQPLISELGQAEVDKKELVFGVQEKSNREMLRNIIIFSIRFSIHKSRWTSFDNPNSAKSKVINMAKHKIRNQIWDQFHLAMNKCQLDEFSSIFLIDNIISKVKRTTLVLNELLE